MDVSRLNARKVLEISILYDGFIIVNVSTPISRYNTKLKRKKSLLQNSGHWYIKMKSYFQLYRIYQLNVNFLIGEALCILFSTISARAWKSDTWSKFRNTQIVSRIKLLYCTAQLLIKCYHHLFTPS